MPTPASEPLPTKSHRSYGVDADHSVQKPTMPDMRGKLRSFQTCYIICNWMQRRTRASTNARLRLWRPCGGFNNRYFPLVSPRQTYAQTSLANCLTFHPGPPRMVSSTPLAVKLPFKVHISLRVGKMYCPSNSSWCFLNGGHVVVFSIN
jgi:hypothetical protein